MRALAVAAALAGPLPLGPALDQVRSYATAGDRAIVAEVHGRRVDVRSRSFSDGAVSAVGTIVAPPRQRVVEPTVMASPGRVAVGIDTEDDESYFRFTGVFAGPPAGPLAALAPFADSARTHRIAGLRGVSGDRTFTFSAGDDVRKGFTYTAHEADGPARAVALPRRAYDAVFAGPLAAYTIRGGLTVADWTTGETVRRIAPFDPDRGWDLRADGTLAFVRAGTLFVAASDGPARRLGRASESEYGGLVWAGDRVVLRRNQHLVVIAPDGTVRRLGPSSADIDGLAADADHVLWSANGCILAARIDDGPSLAPGPGPCLRTEMNEAADVAFRRHGRDAIRLRCIAGPGGVCRGTVQLTRHGKARSPVRRFRVPVGVTRFHRFRGHGTVVRRIITDPGGRRVLERQPVSVYG